MSTSRHLLESLEVSATSMFYLCHSALFELTVLALENRSDRGFAYITILEFRLAMSLSF
jgi:hypothetical protein